MMETLTNPAKNYPDWIRGFKARMNDFAQRFVYSAIFYVFKVTQPRPRGF